MPQQQHLQVRGVIAICVIMKKKGDQQEPRLIRIGISFVNLTHFSLFMLKLEADLKDC